MIHRNWVLVGAFSFVGLLLLCSDQNKAHSPAKNQPYRAVTWGNDANPTTGEVEALITQIFGDLFAVASKEGPSFTVGDFNGDGYKDLAVAVRLSRDVDRNDNSAPDFLLYQKSPGPAPMLDHDSILLDNVFSDGKGEIIYWDGARYRYYPIKTKQSRGQ